MVRCSILLIALAISLLGAFLWPGCVAADDQTNPAPPPTRFFVYDDAGSELNNGVWSNYMPAEAAKDIAIDSDCRDNPKGGQSCLRIEVSLAHSPWAGVAVSSAANYWGEKAGPGFDLSKAESLVFYVRGNKGGEHVQFKMAIASDKPFGDSCDANATEWTKLDREWKQVRLPLKGNLSRIITPFCFVVDSDHAKRDQPIVFFIDGISYEMKK